MLTLELSPGWIALVVMAIAGSLWLGLFAYRNVAYSHELWWHFAVQGDAPRFLRATMVVVLAGTTYSLLRLMQPHVPEPILPDRSELEKARRIARASPCSHSALAMLGDKCLLFNENGDAFVMYQVRGSSWIAMGDPVGPENARESLAWQFREICDTHGGRSIFYQVDADNLAMYVDMGLALLKLGEEALVPLEGFSLQGAARAEMRQIQRRIQREGGSFEVIEPDRVAEHLPRLREISDEWLAAKGRPREGLLAGAFRAGIHQLLPLRAGQTQRQDRRLRQPVGRRRQDRGLGRPDALRGRGPEGHHGLPLHGAFPVGLGSGLPALQSRHGAAVGPRDPSARPLWHRIGTLVYRHGDNFYNFEGLRAYKAKFKPSGARKYLAAPRGLALPSVLLDISALISGGLKGLLGRWACFAAGRLPRLPAMGLRHRHAGPPVPSLPSFLRRQETPSPAGARPGQQAPTEGNLRTEQQGSKALDPGLRRGDESLPTALPAMEARPPAGNDEAEPAAQALSPERANRPGRDLHQRQFLISVPCRRAARQRRHRSRSRSDDRP